MSTSGGALTQQGTCAGSLLKVAMDPLPTGNRLRKVSAAWFSEGLHLAPLVVPFGSHLESLWLCLAATMMRLVKNFEGP